FEAHLNDYFLYMKMSQIAIIKSVLRRYHWLVIGLSIFVLLAMASEIIVHGLGALLGTPSGSGFTRTDSEKIKSGMTEKEVIETLGMPPGNYAHAVWGVSSLPREPAPGEVEEEWDSDIGVIWVHFDEKGKVTYVWFQK